MLYRKKLGYVGFLLCLVLLLTACGNSPEPSASDIETRVVKTVKGDVVIPAHPKRIVAGGHLGSMIALGVKPVGAVKEWEADSPFLQGKVDGITDIGDPHSLEAIVSLKPDLIVLSSAEDIEPFAKIAPTVFIPYEDLTSVEQQITVIAE